MKREDIAWLEWTTPETRELVQELILRVESEFSRISHGLKYRWYYFYKGREETLDAKFLVLNIGVKKVWVMIKAEPARFEDPKAWTKTYGKWFFAGYKYEERGFEISSAGQFDYAPGLIRQSYDISHE